MAVGLRTHIQAWTPQLTAAIPVWMLWLVVVAVTLTVTESLGLDAAETASWIMLLFGLPALLSIVLSSVLRVPLVFTPHVFALIFFGSIGADVAFPELAGASMVAGLLVLFLGATGVTGRVTSWVPAPVVMAVIAGAVVPFVADMFTSLGTEPFIVGSVLVAWVASRLAFGTTVSPIAPALVVGVIATGVAGRFGDGLPGLSLPDPIFISPEFSLEVVLATAPVLAVLMLGANVPSVIYLQEQRFDPHEKMINVVSGGSTLVGALLGPIAVSVALGSIPLVAGPDAGPHEDRHRAAALASVPFLLLAIGATIAAPLAMLVPTALIFAVAGLALLGILVSTLDDVVSGPLRLGPVVAFAVVLSDISLMGLGPFFWSLVLGTGTSLLLEREGWAQLRAPNDATAESRRT